MISSIQSFIERILDFYESIGGERSKLEIKCFSTAKGGVRMELTAPFYTIDDAVDAAWEKNR